MLLEVLLEAAGLSTLILWLVTMITVTIKWRGWVRAVEDRIVLRAGALFAEIQQVATEAGCDEVQRLADRFHSGPPRPAMASTPAVTISARDTAASIVYGKLRKQLIAEARHVSP